MTEDDANLKTVRPVTGAVAGQHAAAQAIGRSRKLVQKMTADRRLHPLLVPGAGMRHCYAVEELSAHVPDGRLHPIPVKRYLPDAILDTQKPRTLRVQAPAVAAGPDPHRQPPPARAATPAEPTEFTQADEAMPVDVVLTQTGMGADQVMREEIRHMGDLESSFDYALHHPGRYAVKQIEPESGAAILIREIDTGAEQSISPSISASRPAATPTTSSPSLHNPGAFAAAEPPAMLPTPVSSSDRMLELLVTYFLKQTGDVAAKMDPSQTAAQFIEMWREGRDSGAEIADEIAGPPPGETNIFDVLIAGMDHVGPNIGEILSLALMRGGNNGAEPAGAEQPADARQIDRPAAA